MFKRKDVMPVLFLFLLILTLMITLSQILVVHHRNHPKMKPRDTRKFQAMLLQLEDSIASMMKSDVLTLSAYERSFLAIVYSERIKGILNEVNNDAEAKVKLKKNENPKNGRSYNLNNDRKSRYLQFLDIRDGNGDQIEHGKHTTHTAHHLDLGNKSTLSVQSKSISNISLNQITRKRGSLQMNSIKTVYSLPVNKSNTKINSLIGSTNHTIDSPCKSQIQSQGQRRHKGQLRAKKLQCTPELSTAKEACPVIPAALVGRLNVSLDITTAAIKSRTNMDIKLGGVWRPRDCVARHHVAIIIPYRDRRKHLDVLLYHLIPILKRQQLDFRIFVAEQAGNKTFNKGRIMNAAFKEAWKMSDFPCFIFHDVDLIPEDDRNMYTCAARPRHMSVAVDKFKYTLPYNTLVGGVLSVRREHFVKMNGYSNLYWGWGAEDDDMAIRMKSVQLHLSRSSITVGRYKMMKHKGRELAPWKWRFYLLKTVHKRFHKDGLNSLEYKLKFSHNNAQFTHLLIDIGDPPRDMPKI